MLARIERMPLALRRGLSLAASVALAYIDRATGAEVSISVLYLVPIAFATWFVDRRWGLSLAVLSAFLWLAADTSADYVVSSALVATWNTLIRVTTFIVMVMLLSALKTQLARVTHASRTDVLTRAYTRRYAYEALEQELIRARRYGHTLALAYVDVDDFKQVNDRYGHAGGDRVLAALAGALQLACRATDVVARIGGDEFLLVLPETDEPAAKSLLERLVAAVSDATAAAGYPITVSIGAMCFGAEITSVDVAVREVDALMFEVKGSGKGRIKLLERRSA